jgi:O-antigen/teichoic acid export membrane protein
VARWKAEAAKISVLLKSRSRHLMSLGWSVGQYVVQPLAMLISIPVLLASLGKDQFGLWVLVMAFVGLDSAAGLGMAAATIKYVSDYRGRGDLEGAARCARQTSTIALIAGSVVGAVIALLAPWLATTVFSKMGDPVTVSRAITVGGVILLLLQMEGVFTAVLKGCERFDAAAISDAIIKVSIFALACISAWLTGDVVLALVVWAAGSLIGVAIRACVASRLLGHSVADLIWDRSTVREVFSFGGWNWLQGVGNSLFLQVDRLVIGAVLGAQALGVYGICMQVASQIHSIPASGLSFIFPVVSRKLAADPRAGVGRLILPAALVNIALSACLALPLLVFGDWLLTIWVGADMQAAVGTLLFWMTLVYFLTSMSIAPYFLLLGSGDVRYASVINIAGGAGSALVAILLVPIMGLMGGVIGRAVTVFLAVAVYGRLYWLASRKPPINTGTDA